MRKSLLVITSIFLMIIISYSFTTADEPLYKNLKLLPKNITKPQLDSVMRHFTRSLGVKCDYCHVRVEGQRELNFASDDDDMKSEARSMIKLQNRINKKYFDIKHPERMDTKLEVSCYSCHHGQTNPARNPPPDLKRQPPPPPEPTIKGE